MAIWSEKNVEARHMIGLAVENDLLVHICRKTTAKEMWDYRDAHEGLMPPQFVAVMLSRLSMSYGTLINVIKSYPKDQIMADLVKNKLRDEWQVK
uniref:Uncharacterized protein n=1 Tax=Anopheles arabiensis TaxID=7173 RepID=A0A182HQE4_ANOAR